MKGGIFVVSKRWSSIAGSKRLHAPGDFQVCFCEGRSSIRMVSLGPGPGSCTRQLLEAGWVQGVVLPPGLFWGVIRSTLGLRAARFLCFAGALPAAGHRHRPGGRRGLPRPGVRFGRFGGGVFGGGFGAGGVLGAGHGVPGRGAGSWDP